MWSPATGCCCSATASTERCPRSARRPGSAGPARAIRSTRLLPAATVPRATLGELAEYRGTETPDDPLVLCLEWFGRQEERP